MRIGLHTSTGGSLERAALRAGGIGANTFQIFSSSPRMWRYSEIDPQQIRLLKKARERFDLKPLAIHASYLINLGSSDAALHEKSIAAFRQELERAVAIGADYVVVHPGNYKGCAAAEEGIASVVKALALAAHGLRTRHLEILIENTVGAGCSIGGNFGELALIRELAGKFVRLPVNFCIDTCHCFASGYDVSTEAGLRDTVKALDRVLGLENVKLIHTNDSKGKFNSHVDRHEQIGKGNIGLEGFRRILNHPKLRGKPFILETPVEDEDDDRRNVEMLKSLAGEKKARRKTLPRLA